MDFLAIEKSLILGKWLLESGPDSQNTALHLAHSIVEGKPSDVLTSTFTKNTLRLSSTDILTDHQLPLHKLLEFPSVDDPESEILRLAIAVACLQAFVQLNWTGPSLDVKIADILSVSSDEENIISSLNAKSISELASGGEPAYHLTSSPLYLRITQILLDQPFKHCQTIPWWKLRATLIHQQVLDEPVLYPPSILSSLQPLSALIGNDPELAARLEIETGLLHHQVGQDRNAAEAFVRAAHRTGLEYELTGALGKRTKFQKTELSQLVLLAESHLSDTSSDSKDETKPTENIRALGPTEPKANVPDALLLNDDTLLEKTEFTSSKPTETSEGHGLSHLDPGNQPPLHPLDQCTLLGLCLNVGNTSPAHGLTTEQMTPYVDRVISHPRNWSIHTMALLLRTRLEAHRTRTVERSVLQLQALVDQMPTADSTLQERLVYFFSLLLPSKWDMERELATRFMTMGVTRSALEIFERSEMWEEVVKCYGSMEQHEKAIAIVRDLLEGRKHEADVILSRGKSSSDARRMNLDSAREAKLWCLLGDLEPERAAEHYQHAWTVSSEKSGRAMRSLGGYYFARGEYKEAIQCLQKAVLINPLLSRSWFILGCTHMRLEEWEDAKNAFVRCVTIDEEDGESWNNLASMYLRLDVPVLKDKPEDPEDTEPRQPSDSIPFSNKMMAFRAMKRGLKYNPTNWRMWANYSIISMDVGELAESAKALSRVFEMTADAQGERTAGIIDLDVLERLVDAVTRAPSNPQDAVEGGEEVLSPERQALRNPNEGHGLFVHVSNMFNHSVLPRIAVDPSSAPRIYRAYARLLTWKGEWEEALKAYLDAYRAGPAGTMAKGETDLVKWKECVAEVDEMLDMFRNFGPRIEEKAEEDGTGKKYNWKLQAKSLVRTFIGKSKDFEDEEPEWSKLMEMSEEMSKKE